MDFLYLVLGAVVLQPKPLNPAVNPRYTVIKKAAH